MMNFIDLRTIREKGSWLDHTAEDYYSHFKLVRRRRILSAMDKLGQIHEDERISSIEKFSNYLKDSSTWSERGDEEEHDYATAQSVEPVEETYTHDAAILTFIGAWDPLEGKLHESLCDEELVRGNIEQLATSGEYSPEFAQALGNLFVEEIEKRASRVERIKLAYRMAKTVSLSYSLFSNEYGGFLVTLGIWMALDRALARHSDYVPAQIAYLETILEAHLGHSPNFEIRELIKRGLNIDDDAAEHFYERYGLYKAPIKELFELNYSEHRLKRSLKRHGHSPVFFFVADSAKAKGAEVLGNLNETVNKWKDFVVRCRREDGGEGTDDAIINEFKEIVGDQRKQRNENYKQRRMRYFNRGGLSVA